MLRVFSRFAPEAFVLVLALLAGTTGCSTLGIATTKDFEAYQTQQSGQSQQTTAQIQSLQQDMADIGTQLTALESTTTQLKQLEQMSRGDLDSLMAAFRSASEELDSMGLSTIAEDIATARANSQRAVQNYLKRLQAEYEALGQEIAELEKLSPPASGSQASGSTEGQ